MITDYERPKGRRMCRLVRVKLLRLLRQSSYKSWVPDANVDFSVDIDVRYTHCPLFLYVSMADAVADPVYYEYETLVNEEGLVSFGDDYWFDIVSDKAEILDVLEKDVRWFFESTLAGNFFD